MLDLSKRKKKYWDLVLHDGTKLQIPTPSRGVYDAVMEVSQKADNANFMEIEQIVKQIMSSNKARVIITEEQMAAFDLDDIYELFISYVDFVHEVISDPNSKSLIAQTQAMREK